MVVTIKNVSQHGQMSPVGQYCPQLRITVSDPLGLPAPCQLGAGVLVGSLSTWTLTPPTSPGPHPAP